MILPTPKGTIWTFRRGESMTWYGMIWHCGSARVKIDNIIPAGNNLEPAQQRGVRQRLLAKFWRRLGAA